MVTVTEDAKTMLDKIIDKVLEKVQQPEIDRNKIGLRLVLQDDGLGLGIDLPREGDQVVERNGNPVLLVDRDTDLLLDGATVGTEDTPEGKKLTISRDSGTPGANGKGN